MGKKRGGGKRENRGPDLGLHQSRKLGKSFPKRMGEKKKRGGKKGEGGGFFFPLFWGKGGDFGNPAGKPPGAAGGG